MIHKENGGLSDARNAGIDAAKGKFLGFVDSDDYVHPRFYELLLQALKGEGADIAGCDVKKSVRQKRSKRKNSSQFGEQFTAEERQRQICMMHKCI